MGAIDAASPFSHPEVVVGSLVVVLGNVDVAIERRALSKLLAQPADLKKQALPESELVTNNIRIAATRKGIILQLNLLRKVLYR